MNELTFSQANGFDELPTQAALGSVSQETRAAIWQIVHDWLDAGVGRFQSGHTRYTALRTQPEELLLRWWVNHKHRMIDEAPSDRDISAWRKTLKAEVTDKFPAPYNLVQFLVSEPDFAENAKFETSLERTRAAYRLVSGRLVPFSTEEEHQQIVDAFAIAGANAASGVRTHLTQAAQELTSGNWAGSMHESISAAESAAKIVSGLENADLGKAVMALTNAGRVPAALGSMMTKLYGYASAERGVRHGLGQDASANVSEREAFFVFSVSASIVSYLLRIPAG